MFDVEHASREKLIGYIYDLEMKLADMTASGDVIQIAEAFGLSLQTAKIVAALSSGRVRSHAALVAAADIPELGTHLSVQIHRTRKVLANFGIEITNLWGVGYQMPAESVAALKAHLSSLRSAG